jgi:transposase
MGEPTWIFCVFVYATNQLSTNLAQEPVFGGIDQREWQISLEIVSAQAEKKGFAVQSRRWVVERSFAWLSKYRSLSKD